MRTTFDLSTTEGRAEALAALKERQSREIKRIDNSSGKAGDPMHYYCHLCHEHTETLPETHVEPPKRHCDLCQELIDLGWSPMRERFVKYETVPCSDCNGHGGYGRDYFTKRFRTCDTCKGACTFRKEVGEFI